MFPGKNLGMTHTKISLRADFIYKKKTWRNGLKIDACKAAKHKTISLWPNRFLFVNIAKPVKALAT